MPAQYGSLKFREAIDFFRQKINLPAERWADVWRAQHNLAFTVAGATKTDLLADLRSMVDGAIAEGRSLTWFQKEFKHLVRKHGWDHTGTAAWRANIIYKTNLRQSYNAGRYAQLQDFPYWRYAHGDSRVPRPHHLSKDGLILPKDAAFWKTWFPQNGWGCECKVFGETEASMKRKNLTPGEEPVINTKEWVDKKTGEVHYVPEGIDPGFDYSPGAVDQATELKTKLAKEKPLRQRQVKRRIPNAFSTNSNVDIYGLNRALGKIPGAQAELDQVGEFVTRYDMKTLFLKPSELSRNSKRLPALRGPVSSYLGISTSQADRHWPVPPQIARRANGYTANAWRHIVVKAKTGINLDKITRPADLTEAVEAAILASKDGMPQWSLSHIVREFTDSGHHGGTIVTWLHEMGHQVQFQAMRNGIDTDRLTDSITRYGNQDVWEWHAEHFAAWALYREKLHEHHPDIAEYFDELIGALLA